MNTRLNVSGEKIKKDSCTAFYISDHLTCVCGHWVTDPQAKGAPAEADPAEGRPAAGSPVPPRGSKASTR